MAKKQYGLGKGLGAILPGAEHHLEEMRRPVGYVNKEIVSTTGATPAKASDIIRIHIDLIEPNPYQPRMTFDEQALEELSESIKALGLIQPITVRSRSEGKYQIVSGERRYRACRMAGMEVIPAYIVQTDDKGMLEMAIVENIQREDLDPIEIAMSYQRLIDECHLTQDQMAQRVGKKRSSITNYLRLLKLSPKLQHDLKEGLLSVGHAKVILGVEDIALQEQLCDLCIREGLSVRALEERIAKMNRSTPSGEAETLPEYCYKAAEVIGRYFDGKVNVKLGKGGSGRVTISFSDQAQLDAFIDLFEKN
ncbi:MAG: ParB/RepB/Spo0J family partition protein [Bacteroidales bacterium]|nr:ParB/RepB/Spo0J family partition protein [Bacteroidales bacterium]